MTLRDHLRAALVRWPLVLGLFVLGLLIGTVVALAQPTTWSSSTLVAIGPRTTSTSTPSSTTIALQDPSIRSTLAQIATVYGLSGAAASAGVSAAENRRARAVGRRRLGMAVSMCWAGFDYSRNPQHWPSRGVLQPDSEAGEPA